MNNLRYLPILFVLAACSSRTSETVHSFRIYEEDGVTIAETTGGPKYDKELFEYEYMLTLQEDEREESILFNPVGFFMDEKGWFYVNDSGNNRIAVFNSDGRYSHAIGKEGQGPGEFRIAMIQSIRGGVVTVNDMIQQRITRFHDDGILIDVTKLAGGLTTTMTVAGYYFLPGDQRLIIAMEADLANPQQLEDMAIRATVTDATGDTLWTMRTPDVRVMEQVMVQIMGQELPLPMPIPFGPQPNMDYHPDFGIVVSAGLAPELDYLNQNGEIQIRVRADIAPEAPTGQDRQLIIQSLRVAQDNAPDIMKQAYQSQIDQLHMPQAKAPWTEAEIDDSGFTWLQLPLPSLMAASDDTTRSFRIINPEGEYLGITTRPKLTISITDNLIGETTLNYLLFRLLPDW